MLNKLRIIKNILTTMLSTMHIIYLSKTKTISRPYKINKRYLAKRNYLSYNNKKSNTTLINIINSFYKS